MLDLLLLLLRPVFLNEDTEFLLDSFDVRLFSDPNVSFLRLGTAFSLATKKNLRHHCCKTSENLLEKVKVLLSFL